MTWIYNFAYLTLLALVWPWLLWKAIRHGKYSAGWSEKFLGHVPRREGQRPCIWLHAVSVGEVNLLQTLLGRLEREYPDWDIVISTTTLTGYALAKKRYAPRTVCYAPLDFSWAVRNAVARIRPRMLILAELELWPNLIQAVKQSGAKVAVMNGRLSDNSFKRYCQFAWFVRHLFSQLDLVAAQTEEYAERFQTLGTPAANVHVTGSLKFDGAMSDRENPSTQKLRQLAGIEPTDIIFLAGSTQEPEEQLALQTFQQHCAKYPQLKLILVPRHPERFEEVATLLQKSGLRWQRRSQWNESTNTTPWQVLLVDAVGELGAWWGTARIAFVGGSLGNRGGQNMIEPAAYGSAIAFGPNTWNFRDVVARFLAAEAAIVIHDGQELSNFVSRCLLEPEFAETLGEKAASLVRSQQGAADHTIQLLRPLLMEPVLEKLPRPPHLFMDCARVTTHRKAS